MTICDKCGRPLKLTEVQHAMGYKKKQKPQKTKLEEAFETLKKLSNSLQNREPEYESQYQVCSAELCPECKEKYCENIAKWFEGWGEENE